MKRRFTVVGSMRPDGTRDQLPMGPEAVERAARHARVWRQRNAKLASLEAIITRRTIVARRAIRSAGWVAARGATPVTSAVDAALARALTREGQAVAELEDTAAALRAALAELAEQRERARAWQLLAMRLLVVLDLDTPDGIPGPALEGDLLTAARHIATQAQRVPALELLVERYRQKGSGAPESPGPRLDR